MEMLVLNSIKNYRWKLSLWLSHSFMMKTPCKANFKFLHVVINLMNVLSRQRVFRLQKTLNAMLELRGAIALSQQYLTNKLKLVSLADAKEEFSAKSAYSVGCFQWHPARTDSASVWCHLH